MPERNQPPIVMGEGGNILYERGRQNDQCVGLTIASLCSKLSGRQIDLPPIYYAWRGMQITDLKRTQHKHLQEGEGKDRVRLASIKLDQRVFRGMLETIKRNGVAFWDATPVAAILAESDIAYKRGGFEEISADLNSGHEVAVMFQVEDPQKPGRRIRHMAHLGFDQDGVLVNHSDGHIVVDDTTINAINADAHFLNGKVRTWNYASVRLRTDYWSK